MDKETLRKLELTNQLRLTDAQKEDTAVFFSERESELQELQNIDTAGTERMVHVMPVMTVVRPDVASQPYRREDLQQAALETDEGYWCVPRVME